MRDRILHGRRNQGRPPHHPIGPAGWRTHRRILLHRRHRLRSARASIIRSQPTARPGAGNRKNRRPRWTSLLSPRRRLLDRAQQHRRFGRVPCSRCSSAFRSRHRPLSTSRFRSIASPLGHALGRAIDPICNRRSLYFPGAGRNLSQRCLRRAGQHGRDRLLHPLLISICVNVQIAKPTRRRRSNSSTRRKASCLRPVDSRIHYHRIHHRALRFAPAGRTE